MFPLSFSRTMSYRSRVSLLSKFSSVWTIKCLIITTLLITNVATILKFVSNTPFHTSIMEKTESPGKSKSDSGNMLWDSEQNFERGHGLQGFVLFSSYRLSPSKFVVIGLTPIVLHHSMKGQICRWQPENKGSSEIHGTLVLDYPGDAHGKAYEVALLFCTLEQEVRREGGGELFVTVEADEMPVYLEKPGSNGPIRAQEPFPHNLTFCSAPLFGEFHVPRMAQFLQFYTSIHGVDYFYMYDVGGVDKDLISLFKPFVESGKMTISDVSQVNEFETWYAQVLVISDCAYRSYLTSKWTLFADLDEFLYVKQPPHSIQSVLQKYDDMAWLSFGSEYWHTKECTHSLNITEALPQQPWDLERLVFRQSEIHCVNPKKFPSRNLCAGYAGHRKYLANPRKVVLFGIHQVVKSLEKGMDLDTDVAHIKHFRAWNLRSTRVCQQYIHDTDWIPKSWARDFSMAKVAQTARLQIS